jgi:hypothetical protein
MRRWLAGASTIICLLGLSACSLSSTIGSAAVDYNRSVADSGDAMIVLNVLRARDMAPLHFTTVPQVRGSLTVGAGINFTVPVGGSTGNVIANTASPTISTSPSFDVATLDTQEFARGLLEPIAVETFKYFWDRGVPQELLLHLFIAEIDDDRYSAPIVNRGRRPRSTAEQMEADLFQRRVQDLIEHEHLKFNAYTALEPIGPVLTRTEVARLDALVNAGKEGVKVEPVPGGYQVFRVVQKIAVCQIDRAGRVSELNVARPPRPQSRMNHPPQRPGAQSVCSDPEVRLAHLVGEEMPSASITFYLRSVEGVFQYLGDIIHDSDVGRKYAGRKTPAGDASSGATGSQAEEVVLFALSEERLGDARFSVEYRGKTYYVPEASERNYTVLVLSLVEQLLNLNKKSEAIPTTRAVQVLP